MSENNENSVHKAIETLTLYYPNRTDLIKALDEIQYALFYVEHESFLPSDIQNMAFTIKSLKNLILA